MPAKTITEISIHGDIALLSISSTDPRRNGRVDCAIFDAVFEPIISEEDWFVRGGAIVNSIGTHFSAFISNCLHMHTRLEENEDYTKDNYVKRYLDAEVRKKGIEASKKARIERILLENKKFPGGFHPRMKWIDKNEVVELPIIIDKHDVITVKINKFLAHYVPKAGILGSNGIHLRDAENPSSAKMGRLLTSHILMKLGCQLCPRSVLLFDKYNLVMDTTSMDFVSSVRNKVKFYEHGSQVVMEIIMSHFDTYPWQPEDVKYRYPASVDMHTAETRTYYVVFDAEVMPKLKEHDMTWYVGNSRLRRNGIVQNSLEVIANTDDSYEIKTLSLRRFLAIAYGLECGEVIIPSRMSKLYERACNGGLEDKKALRLRARLEGLTGEEKVGSKCLYTKQRKLQYRTVHADKEYFAEWMWGGVGQWCRDMRKQSMRIGGRKDELQGSQTQDD